MARAVMVFMQSFGAVSKAKSRFGSCRSSSRAFCDPPSALAMGMATTVRVSTN